MAGRPLRREREKNPFSAHPKAQPNYVPAIVLAEERRRKKLEREAKLGEAVGLVQAGASFRFAETLSGIPYSTIYDAYQRILGPNAVDRETARKDSEARIEATAAAVSEQTLASMARDLELDALEPFLAPSEKTGYLAATTKALQRIRGNAGQQDSDHRSEWADVADRLASVGGGTVTVKVEHDAIDVTPKSSRKLPKALDHSR